MTRSIELHVEQTVRRNCHALEFGTLSGDGGGQRHSDLAQHRVALRSAPSSRTRCDRAAAERPTVPESGRHRAQRQRALARGGAGGRPSGRRARAQSISAGGQRIFFNYYTLDGVNNTDPNFNNYIALPSIDAIQEFKVQTGVYPAEFGHQSTQVNVVTKSGGNAFHGSVFEFLRDEKFDAKPYAFTSVHPAKSPFKWNDFGFEVDGPVWRDKLFFMGNFEVLRRRKQLQNNYSVPLAAWRTGDFSS